MAKKAPTKEKPAAAPVVAKSAAGDCPTNAKHANTRIYRTMGSIRFCVCDDCGTTWKATRAAEDLSGDDREYLRQLADELETAARDKDQDGRQVLVIEDTAVAGIVDRLREIAT